MDAVDNSADTRPRQDPDERWEYLRALTEADLRGESPPSVRAYLVEHADEWCDTLGDLLSDVNAQLQQRKAEAQVKQNECHAMPSEAGGKREWFEYRGEYESWRARTVRFKSFVERRKREANRILKERRLDRHDDHMENRDKQHRRALTEVRSFLAEDSHISYSAIPERDGILEWIDEALYGGSDAA